MSHVLWKQLTGPYSCEKSVPRVGVSPLIMCVSLRTHGQERMRALPGDPSPFIMQQARMILPASISRIRGSLSIGQSASPDSFYILAGPRVDLQRVTLVYEEWNLYGHSGFKSGGLGRAAGSVTLQAGVG